MKNFKLVLLIIISLSAVSILSAFVPKEASNLEIRPDEMVKTEIRGRMRVEEESKKPVALYMVDYQVNTASPEDMARQYLRENATKLHLENGAEDLSFVSTMQTPSGGYRVRFEQVLGKIPVYNTNITVSINNKNQVVFVMNGYRELSRIKRNASSTLNMSDDAAITMARNYLGLQEPAHREEKRVVYYADKESIRLAHWIELMVTKGNIGAWEIILDANSGKILKAVDNSAYNRNRETGSGWVFDPDPCTSGQTSYGMPGFVDNNDSDSDSLTNHLVEVDLLDITYEDGEYILIGPYLNIVDEEEPFTGLHTLDSPNFHFTRSDDNFEAVNIYHHGDKSMRYLESLGWDLLPTNGVHFDPHGLNNAFNAHMISNADYGLMAYGDPAGGVGAGEDLAIIIHELMHGIHNWITGGGLSQVDGLGEGCSDYWASSYIRSLGYFGPNDEQYNWFCRWGLRSASSGPYMRVLDHPGHYPEDLGGEVHYDGQLWSASLMTVYEVVGKDVCDRILLEAMSMTNGATNQRDAAFAFIQADRDLYDGEHMGIIVETFTDRGYITGPVMPEFTSDVSGGEAPLTVNFTDLTFAFPLPATSWQWDFDGDGTIDSNDQNPQHTYQEAGLYSVTLTVSNGTEGSFITKEDFICVNDGILVWEGLANGQDYSGAFIRDFIADTQQPFVYKGGGAVPSSLIGFDAVFLSFGNVGNNYTAFTNDAADAVIEYLEAGGKVFIEGSDALGYNQAANETLHNLLSLSEATDGQGQPNFINGLDGVDGAITEGMHFTSSTQVSNTWIDLFEPNENGMVAFTESNYGDVAVQGSGGNGQKSFVFSYAIGCLSDQTAPTTKYHLMAKIMNHFDFDVPLIGSIGANTFSGHMPLTVNFSDNSISTDQDNPINSWQWDFDGDGVIDSEEQNPEFEYAQTGYYDVTLTISNGVETRTIDRGDYIRVFDGQSALEFDGESSLMTIQPNGNLSPRDELTLEAWIHPTGWGNPYGLIFFKQAFIMAINGENDTQFGLPDHCLAVVVVTGNGNETVYYTPENSLELNQWQHIAFSYSEATSMVQVYINGQMQALGYINEPPQGELINHFQSPLYVGSVSNEGHYFEGVIDEIRFWNVVRSGYDINNCATDNLNGNEIGLIGLWRMNDGQGVYVFDNSINNNHAQILGARWALGCPELPPLGVERENSLRRLTPKALSANNYPNPFNPTTTINYSIPEKAEVVLNIYNVKGQLVNTLVKSEMEPGNYSVVWDGKNGNDTEVSSGVYFYRLSAGKSEKAGKMLLMK